MVSYLNDGVDDTLCGIIMIIVTVFYMVLYCIILRIFYTRQDKFNVPVYTQLFHMGLNDCVQLTCHLVGGLSVLFQYEMPGFLNKVIGGLYNTALFSWVAFSYSISLNRFLAFCYPHLYNVFYSKSFLRYQIAFCWIVLFGGLIIYLSPLVTCRFYRLKFAWKYDHSTLWYSTLSWTDFVWTTSMMGLSLLNYAFIVIRMKSLKLTSTGKSGNQEIRVFIQAVFLCLWCTFVQFHWHYKSYYMPNSRYSSFFSNFIGILNCATNPTLCLTVNPSIRTAFLEFVRYKPQNRNVVVVQPCIT